MSARAVANGRTTDAAAAVFRALGHSTRIRVLIELQGGHRSPAQLARHLEDPGVSLPSLSYHVRGLHGAGLIELAFTTPRRGALEHSYGLTASGRAAARMATALVAE
jgi:DNA-binding transcriptional ArsR family regulator